jgi:hypothetical protein
MRQYDHRDRRLGRSEGIADDDEVATEYRIVGGGQYDASPHGQQAGRGERDPYNGRAKADGKDAHRRRRSVIEGRSPVIGR